MDYSGLSPVEIYLNRVFKLIIVGIPCIGICAGLTFSILKLLGCYPSVPNWAILLFDAINILYVIVGISLYRKCDDEDGVLKPEILKKGKRFILLVIVIQWNLISVIIPSRDFWAYALFFVLLSGAFLDRRFEAIAILEILVSIVVTWLFFPERLLPVQDSLFSAEMVLRVVLLLFGFGTIWTMTLMIEKGLVNELEKIADYDTLTLLYNRRKLQNKLEAAVLQETKLGQPFSVIMADIDDFKAVNDTYGHSCGDEVLKDVANIIRTSVEKKGDVFRYGGEEMLVLLYAGEEEANLVAEGIRRRVERHKTVFDKKEISVTVTLGVAVHLEKDTREELLKRADANLYYGKNHGKNCVMK